MILGIKPYGATFTEVFDRLRPEPNLEIVECESTVDAVATCQVRLGKEFHSSIILFFASNVIEAIKSITMLKMLGPEINSGLICPFLMTDLTQLPLLSKFKFFGCQEIVSERTPVKGLIFKIQRNLNLLQKIYLEKNPPPAALRTLHHRKAFPSADEISAERLFRFTKPLNIRSDFWILADNPVRRIGGRWVVMLKGPNPLIGRWEPASNVTAIKHEDENEWVWTIRNPGKHPFVSPEGKWVFRGQKPLFKGGLWWFVGSRAELNFIDTGDYIGMKLFYDHFDLLKIARDSSADPDVAEGYGRFDENAHEEEHAFLDTNFLPPDPTMLNAQRPAVGSGLASFKKDAEKAELSAKPHVEKDPQADPSITTKAPTSRELSLRTKSENGDSSEKSSLTTDENDERPETVHCYQKRNRARALYKNAKRTRERERSIDYDEYRSIKRAFSFFSRPRRKKSDPHRKRFRSSRSSRGRFFRGGHPV